MFVERSMEFIRIISSKRTYGKEAEQTKVLERYTLCVRACVHGCVCVCLYVCAGTSACVCMCYFFTLNNHITVPRKGFFTKKVI